MIATTLLRLTISALAAAPAIAGGVRAHTSVPAAPLLALGAAASDPVIDALTDQLRAALLEHSDLEQDALLRSLRQLRDPGLRALFAQITTSDRAVLRVHGVLGLAELESPPRVDLLLVKRMHDPREQLVVVGEALRAGMLPTEQLEDVARWPGLDPALVVLIMGRLQRAGVEIDPAALDPFIRGEHAEAAIYAALELHERRSDTVGGAPEAQAILDRVLAMPRAAPESDEAVGVILQHIREERLARSAWFAQRVLGGEDQDSFSEPLRFEALRALLTVAPADSLTVDAFRAWFGRSDTLGRRTLAMAALEAIIEQPLLPPDIAGPPAPALPPELFALLREDPDALLHRLADAGESALLGCTPDAVAAVTDLIADPHGATLAWAVRFARRCSSEASRAIHLAVLRASTGAKPSHPALTGAGIAAAAALAADDPSLLLAPLGDALGAEDAVAQGIILAGALRSANPAAASLGWPPVPLRPFDDEPIVGAMADLLRLRHSESLTEEDFHTLAAIALDLDADGHLDVEADEPPLPEALRVQAAWLALRSRGQQRIALMRILAGPPRAAEPNGVEPVR